MYQVVNMVLYGEPGNVVVRLLGQTGSDEATGSRCPQCWQMAAMLQGMNKRREKYRLTGTRQAGHADPKAWCDEISSAAGQAARSKAHIVKDGEIGQGMSEPGQTVRSPAYLAAPDRLQAIRLSP